MESPAKIMFKLYPCNKEASCSKKYKSKKSLSRHIKREHPISKRPSTPLPSNASTDSEPSARMRSIGERQSIPHPSNAPTDNKPSARIQNGFFGRKVEMAAKSETTSSDSSHATSYNDSIEKHLFYRIIDDFLTYWNDDDIEMKLRMDPIAILLIKHSRIAKRNDANYLALASAFSDTIYHGTLFNLANKFYKNVKEEYEYFNWDSLIIAFTIGHNSLIKHPHMRQDVVDMLLEVFNLASDDFSKLGGWPNFIEYSNRYYM